MSDKPINPRPSPSSSPAWRGRTDPTASQARYRWQKGGAAVQQTTPQRRRSHRGAKLVLVAIGFFALFGAFIYNVLHAPKRTPVLLVTTENYRAPLPPLPWIAEEIADLRKLDGNTISLHVVRFDDATAGMRDLRHAVTEIAKGQPDALIVYVAMHGATDDNDHPCLLTGSSRATDCDSWLRLDELLQTVRSPVGLKSCQTLLVMDAIRQRLPIATAASFHTFPSHVDRLIHELADERLHVLTSTDDGQPGYSSAELGRSLFAYYFQRGLSGQADLSGDKNHVVSAHELTQYVQTSVQNWSLYNRGLLQTPRQLTKIASDYPLCSSAHFLPELRGLAFQVQHSAQEPTIDGKQQEDLWQRFVQLTASADLIRYAPETFHRWEQSLLRLHRLSLAGRAYTGELQQALQQLDVEFAALEDSLRSAEGYSRSMMHAWRRTSATPLNITATYAKDFNAATYLGLLTSTDQQQLEQQFSRAAELPDPAAVAAAIDGLNQHAIAAGSEELHVLRLLKRYHVVAGWSDPQVTQEFIRCRALASLAAVPASRQMSVTGDERAHAWLRPAVNSIDQSLRSAQDLYFAGSHEGMQFSAATFSEISQRYATVLDNAEEVATANKLRDELAARIPAFLTWYVAADRPALPDQEIPAELQRTREACQTLWLPIVQTGRKLAEQLAADPQEATPSTANSHEPLRRLAEQLVGTDAEIGPWLRLQREFENYCEALRNAPPSGLVAQQIAVLLDTPLLSPQQRLGLLERLQEVSTKLHESYFAEAQSVHADNKPTAASAHGRYVEDYPAWLNDISVSPLVAWFSPSGSLPSQAAELVVSRQATKEVRALIGSIADKINRVDASSDTPQDGEADRQVDTVVQIETMARLVGSELSSTSLAAAVTLRRRFDMQQWMLWRSERAVFDFWGPATSLAPPFFVEAAESYLRGANTFWPVADLDRRRAAIESLAERARQLWGLSPERSAITAENDRHADMFVTVAAVDAKSPDSTHNLSILGSEIDGWVSTYVTTNETPDVKSVELQLVHADLNGVEIPAFTLSQLTPNFTLRLHGHRKESDGTTYRCVTMFRGHEVVSSFEANSKAGIEIVTVPVADRATSVTLYRERPHLGSVMFVLDSSNSMSRTLPDASNPSNLQIAVKGLLEVANGLVSHGDVRGGLCVYGHRLGFGRLTGKVRVQPNYEKIVDDTLRPQQDIEFLAKIGSLDRHDVNDWSLRLNELVGWGQSPHFGSLRKALDELTSHDQRGPHAIVLLTDGNQVALQAEELAQQDDSTKDSLMSQVDRAKIPIHIMLVGDRSADDLEILHEIASSSGGSLHLDGNASAVVDAIASGADQVLYRIADSDERLVAVVPDGDATEARLGNPLVISGEIPRTGPLNVQVDDVRQEIMCRGGERMELEYDANRHEILAPAFNRRLAQVMPLWDGQQQVESPIHAFIHRPMRTGDSVQFTATLQTIDRQFVSWPASAWVEIRPVSGTSVTGQAYIFFAMPNSPDIPVPAVTCVVPNWPPAADRADVRLWFSMDRPEAAMEIPLQECIQGLDNTTDGVPPRAQFDGPNGSRFSVASRPLESGQELVEIRVTQYLDAVNSAVTPAGVDLELPAALTPVRIIRSYQPDQHQVSHHFEFNAGQFNEVRQQAMLRVVLREAFEQQGLSFGRQPSVLVDVSGADNYLSTAP